MRSRFLLAPGEKEQVAQCYDHNPPEGYSSDGVGGAELPDLSWGPQVFLVQEDPAPRADATVMAQTAADPRGVMVRITPSTTSSPGSTR